jgi:hypothetical protein
MALPTDPFSLTFNALWDLAEASLPLTSLVKVGNRIKTNQPTNRDFIKPSVMASDLPELVLSTVGSNETNMYYNSCTTKVQRTYTWIISTGDFRTNYLLYPVQFALLCAMCDWQGALTSLQWNGAQFIKLAQLVSLNEGVSNPEQNRGIQGWSSLWGCSVEMYLPTALLKSYNAQT